MCFNKRQNRKSQWLKMFREGYFFTFTRSKPSFMGKNNLK